MNRTFPRLILFGLLSLASLRVLAFMAPQTPTPENFDSRKPARQPASADARRAEAALAARVPGAKVDRDLVTGAPKSISVNGGFLTGTNGLGRGVSPASARAFAPDDPHRALKGFLNEHSAIFGHDAAALNAAAVTREFTGAKDGIHTVVWQQQVGGVAVFEATLVAHTTKRGELVSVAGRFIPNPALAAVHGGGKSAPTIAAARALALAAENLGQLVNSKSPVQRKAAAGAEQKQSLAAAGLRGDAGAQLVWLPMDAGALRLCWQVTLTVDAHAEMFSVLVDAETGKVLLRRCLTQYISDVTYRVWTSDSPSPFSPGHATPLTSQPAEIPRSLVTFDALNDIASPNGWINDGNNETLGNNVDAHADRNNDNVADVPRPSGSPFRTFDITLDLTQDPTNYTAAATVQLFYWCNFMHDKLYDLGFTEAAGNFQTDNFGRGGLGADAVQADSQDGGGFNNANMSTPTDGSAPRMQMYIFSGPTPHRDGDLDAEIVLHEFTHGLSNRRVGGGGGISALQSGGMGEGWSDFYALALLSEAGDDVNGNYAMGGYATLQLGGLAQNYYYGIRRYPYSTDLAKNPLTFKDSDPVQISAHAGVPVNPVLGGGAANEVHHLGEIWCMTLWEARANLIAKHGFATGNALTLQLVTAGMNLSPLNPNFLQARDGILAADLAITGGANQTNLWAAFAKRGMGFSAVSPDSSTTSGVEESFDMPDDLRIAPVSGFTSRGPVGGPFNISSQNFTLNNVGVAPLDWSCVNTSAWLVVSPASGTLAAGDSTTVNISLTAGASALPMGIYPDTATFSNAVTFATQKRAFKLLVGQPDYFTELFTGTSPDDLSFQSFTFTPDGSTSFYSVCRQPAASFPTDPAGGTTVTLSDDSFAQATLSGVNSVAIYGTRTNTVFIASNGYLTMNSGSQEYAPAFATHFALPRVAALFTDLDPPLGGTISWRQTVDRLAVTYLNVHEYGNSSQSNSFQMEMFFDGRIRVTCLGISAVGGLAGLSAGTGVPANFAQSDLTSYGDCPPLTVTVVPVAYENAPAIVGGGTVSLGAAQGSDLVVSLASGAPSRLTVPASVTVLAGTTFATFNLTPVNNALADGNISVTVTASASGFTNVAAAILIIDDETLPIITSQPTNTSVLAGGTATFSVSANGAVPFAYQWRKAGSPIGGATGAGYSKSNVQTNDAGGYSVVVSNVFGMVTSATAQLTVVVPPPNDLCSNAVAVLSAPFTDSLSTTNATTTTDPVPTCGFGMGKSVWYQFTPGASGQMIVDTVGSSFDTMLATYTGGCGAFTQAGCDDDSGGSLTSRITNSISAGVTYFIEAGGYNGTSGSLVFHLASTAQPNVPVKFLAPKSAGGALQLSLARMDGLPLTTGQVALLQLRSTTNPGLAFASWPVVTNALTISNGTATVNGLLVTNPAQRYFRTVQGP